VLGLQAFWVLAAALLAAVLLSLATESFATPQNLFNVTRNFAFVAIVAIGMTAVIITGGIDLAVGSILCLSAMVTGVVLHAGTSVWVGIAAGLVAALAVGLVNGALITYVGIPPFVATLGMLSIARSLAAMVSSQNTMVYQFGPDHDLFLWLGGGSTLGVPNPVVVLAACCLTAGFALNWTRWGARIMAVGGNERAAILTGLPVRRIKIGIYMLSGFMAGLAGVLEASWLGGVTTNLGQSMELSVIAAAVIGGANLTGGHGTILGAVVRRRAHRDHSQQPDLARHQHVLAGHLRRHLHRGGRGVRQRAQGPPQLDVVTPSRPTCAPGAPGGTTSP
jgi:ribose transport system permease protein